MQLFRNLEEPKSTDITQYPGYSKLSGDEQKKVAETYTNVYNNNQGKLGYRVAQGIAFETAKKMCESYVEEAASPAAAARAKAWRATERARNTQTSADHLKAQKAHVEAAKLHDGAKAKEHRGQAGVHGSIAASYRKHEDGNPKFQREGQDPAPGLVADEAGDDVVDTKISKPGPTYEGDAEDFQAGNDSLVGMTEKKDPITGMPTYDLEKTAMMKKIIAGLVSGANPEEDGAAKILRMNHDTMCSGCGAVHPVDVMCFNGRTHSEAGAGGGNGSADILKQNHAQKGMKVEDSDPEIAAAARYLTNRAKVSGLMESKEGAEDIQKKNVGQKCPDCGAMHDPKDECNNQSEPDTDKETKKEVDDANEILKKNHKDKGLEEKHIGFKALQGKLERSGKSAESAGAIAASIGKKKYGAAAMKKGAASHTPLGEDVELNEEIEQMWAENFYPAKPLEESCGNCSHPKSYHSKACQTCNECAGFVKEADVEESEHKKNQICYCGHEYGHHGNGGCKTCKHEGVVTPIKAAHQFRKNDYKERFEDEYNQIFAAQQGKINTSLANASLNWLPEELELQEGKGYDDIGPGDHVKFNHPLRGSDKVPQQGKGKVVMKGPAGWVVNMGGKHGTPGIVSKDNYVSHRKAAKKMTEDEIQEASYISPGTRCSECGATKADHTKRKAGPGFAVCKKFTLSSEDGGRPERRKAQYVYGGVKEDAQPTAASKAWAATEKARNSQSEVDHRAAEKAHRNAESVHARTYAAKEHKDQADVHKYLADFTKKHGAKWTKHQPQTMKEEGIRPSYHSTLTSNGFKPSGESDPEGHHTYTNGKNHSVVVHPDDTWSHKGSNKKLVANTGDSPVSLHHHLKKVAGRERSADNRKERDATMKSLGLNKVKGSVSGKTYWESEENPEEYEPGNYKEETDPLMAASLGYINSEVARAGGPMSEDEMNEWKTRRSQFADPGGNSALRAASKANPRNLPCPTCKEPNKLTAKDVAKKYQCDNCANMEERGW